MSGQILRNLDFRKPYVIDKFCNNTERCLIHVLLNTINCKWHEVLKFIQFHGKL